MLSRWLRHLPAPVQSAIHGVSLTVLACALFALLDSATKFTGQLLPVLMVLWLRFLAQALVTSALVLPRHGLSALKTSSLRFQLLRAISGLLAVIAIVRPENDGNPLGLAALWPLGLLICGTTYQVLGSRLSRLDSPPTTQLYSTWLPILLTTPLMGFAKHPIEHWQVYAAAAVMGLCSGVGHLMLLQAYTHATPATVAPFLYSQIGFAMLLGRLFFGQIPDGTSLAGMAVVTLSGLLGVRLRVREKR